MVFGEGYKVWEFGLENLAYQLRSSLKRFVRRQKMSTSTRIQAKITLIFVTHDVQTFESCLTVIKGTSPPALHRKPNHHANLYNLMHPQADGLLLWKSWTLCRCCQPKRVCSPRLTVDGMGWKEKTTFKIHLRFRLMIFTHANAQKHSFQASCFGMNQAKCNFLISARHCTSRKCH